MSETRDPFTRKIELILSEYLGHEIQQEICKDSNLLFNLLVTLILDCTTVDLKLREPQGITPHTSLNWSPGNYVMHCIVNGLVGW